MGNLLTSVCKNVLNSTWAEPISIIGRNVKLISMKTNTRQIIDFFAPDLSCQSSKYWNSSIKSGMRILLISSVIKVEKYVATSTDSQLIAYT